MTLLQKELNMRLTFAIISHPDAGKTTITEKLLLFGGAIHAAGAVKSKRSNRGTTSDFMQLERERGISISTSVMGFEHQGRKINLLDTPGHEDFSEDTYRTLSAVDSALMMIDSVKGVEERTRKLCEICRMRHTPIVTFINKMDREGKPPIDVLDEVEKELSIYVCPMTWPVGQGKDFRGVYSLYDQRLILFDPHATIEEGQYVQVEGLEDPLLEKEIGEHLANKLREEIEMVGAIYPRFQKQDYLDGLITPIFFGSALNNFGIRELLDHLIQIAPAALSHETESRIVPPDEEKFSGFIFKIHANLDPKHRDRIAFMRICSGIFEKNKMYIHPRSGKNYRTNNPTAFMAQSRDIIDKAYPGDIIGLHDTGIFRIGDSLTEGENLIFKGIPAFSPQIFRKVVNLDPLKNKQFNKGLDELSEEGIIQVFTLLQSKERLVGAVGFLQFDVTQFRMQHEYGANSRFDGVDYQIACWVTAKEKNILQKFITYYQDRIATDNKGNHVFLSNSRWVLDKIIEEYPDVQFHFTSDF
ncbi:MAG: peptide chain release factor 3 [Spirochaetia bacterium]